MFFDVIAGKLPLFFKKKINKFAGKLPQKRATVQGKQTRQ
jgi:hypothetical protein